MPGTRCAVFGCNNTYDTNNSRADGKKIILHSFPKFKDLVSKTMREEWVRRCSRSDKFNVARSRICSEHFAETDYERDLEHELLGLPLRKVLKKTAVPTIGIRKIIPIKSKSSINRDGRIAKKRCKEIVADLIVEATFKNTEEKIQQEGKVTESVLVTNMFREEDVPENINDSCVIDDSSSCVEKLQITTPILKNNDDFNNDDSISPSTSGFTETSKCDEEKYAQLLKAHDDLKSKYKVMQHNLKEKTRKIKSLNDQVRYFKAKSCRSPKLNKQVNALLKEVLTENQIALLSIKKRVNWTNEEI